MGNKTYLGYGVYVQRNEWDQIVLTTEDGVRTTNSVVLEPEVLGQFMSWLGFFRERPNPASAMFRQGEGGKFTSDGKVKVKDGEV